MIKSPVAVQESVTESEVFLGQVKVTYERGAARCRYC